MPFDTAQPPEQLGSLDCSIATLVISDTPTASTSHDILRDIIRDTSKTIAKCGQYVTGTHARIIENRSGVRWSGLSQCNCAHSCHRCSPDLADIRALGISEGFELARAAGCQIVHITLTHAPLGRTLRGELDWHDAVTSRLTKRLREKRGIGRSVAGYVSGRDITLTEFDSHPHQHLAVCVRPGYDPADVAQAIINAHLNLADAAGGSADSIGQNYRIVEPDNDYRVAFYVVSGAVRHGNNNESSTARDIRDAAAAGDERAADCYREYVRAMHRRRQVTASGCLKGHLEPEGEPASEPTIIADVERVGFKVLKRDAIHERIIRRIADAVGGGARRLVAHELLLRYLPAESPTERLWQVNWHGHEDTYYASRAYHDDHGWHPDDDHDDETVDGWSRAAYDDHAAWDIIAAELEAEHKAQERQRRREQRARCAARKAEAARYARAGDHAAFRNMTSRIEAYWSARCQDVVGPELRQLRIAGNAQVRSIRRAWTEALREVAR